jgi:uncharacterized protein (DUF983 family)
MTCIAPCCQYTHPQATVRLACSIFSGSMCDYDNKMSPTASQKWWAMLRQRCPRCCEGNIYQRGMQMNERCPVCNLRFEREPGYFLGAMYISYGLASILLIIGLGIGHLVLPEMDLGWIVLICCGLFIPFVPAVTRYSRVIWIYFDRWSWPGRPGESE